MSILYKTCQNTDQITSGVIIVTLARGGSKGIKRKNLAIVGNKTLLGRTIEVVNNVNNVDAYVVSTDSDDIELEAQRHNVTVIRRPSYLATDDAKSSAAIKHAVEHIERIRGCKFSIVVEVMCTTPFKLATDIDACISKLRESKADSVVSVMRVYDHHPSRLKYLDPIHNILLPFFPETPESRRQALVPEAYVRAGGIYAFKRDLLDIDDGYRYTAYTHAVELPPIRALNIDEELDLYLAQALAEKDGL